MAIIYYTTGAWGAGKGANLTPAEADGNFAGLSARLDLVDGALAVPNEIESITVDAAGMTIGLEDATSYGPFALPTARLIWRGDWSAATVYAKRDIVKNPATGDLYFVLQAHVSGDAFDPALQVGGNDAYAVMVTFGAGGGARWTPGVVSIAASASSYPMQRSLHANRFLYANAPVGERVRFFMAGFLSGAVPPFAVNDEIVIYQAGEGDVSVVMSKFLTLKMRGVTHTGDADTEVFVSGRGSAITLKKIAQGVDLGSDEWVLFGDFLTPSGA